MVQCRRNLPGLEARKCASAIDVFDQEPLPPNSPFWDLENVIVTPHSAGFVEGWEPIVAELFCDNLEYWLRGAPLQNVVVPARGY